MQFAIVIMAAGKGTRLNSKRPKVLHEVGGKTLLRHVVDAARQVVPPEDIYVIVGHEAGLVKDSISSLGVQFIEQAEQRGTGHAMQQTRQAVEEYANVIVLYGDVPLIRPETIKRIRDFHLQHGAAMTVLTASPKDPDGYGRVIRKSNSSNEVRAIVEQKALTPEQARHGGGQLGNLRLFEQAPVCLHRQPENKQRSPRVLPDRYGGNPGSSRRTGAGARSRGPGRGVRRQYHRGDDGD